MRPRKDLRKEEEEEEEDEDSSQGRRGGKEGGKIRWALFSSFFILHSPNNGLLDGSWPTSLFHVSVAH